MNVLAIPTIRRFDTLVTTVTSALEGSVPPDKFLIIDNSGGKAKDYLPRVPEIEIHASPYNYGVARSWNVIMSMYGQFGNVVISNDDVVFHRHTYEALLSASADIVYPKAHPDNLFSLFLLPYSTWERVGPFDVRFYPAYFEDNDFWWRMLQLGMTSLRVDATYDHVGSATLKSYDVIEMRLHHETFDANRRRYVRKWGGEPGHEKYKVAYNGQI